MLTAQEHVNRIETARTENGGTLPAYTDLGGYPLYYLAADCEPICPDCANGKNGAECSTAADTSDDWRLVAMDVYWEGPDMQCVHCGAAIKSAYGDPDES